MGNLVKWAQGMSDFSEMYFVGYIPDRRNDIFPMWNFVVRFTDWLGLESTNYIYYDFLWINLSNYKIFTMTQLRVVQNFTSQ